MRKWQKEKVGVLNTKIAVAKEIIWRLDVAEEGRPLSEPKRVLRRQIKASYLGLLAIQKVKMRQARVLTGSVWGMPPPSLSMPEPMEEGARISFRPS